MLCSPKITEKDIRACLVTRAKGYAQAAGTSLSAIGLAAVGDNKFIFRVESGLSFQVSTYQRVMDWLDVAEAKLSKGGSL